MKEKNIEFYVEGMHCAACELTIEKKLSKVSGIKKVDAKLNKGKVYIESERELDPKALSKLVENDGYKIVSEKEESRKINWSEIKISILISLSLVFLFVLIQRSGIIDALDTNEVNLPFVFLIGIVASISTCMAVVGGLVLSISSNYAKEGSKTKPLILFHISRLLGFFILGGFIGLIGSAFILSDELTFGLNLILFFVMILIGLNLLELTPHSKKVQFKIPKVIGKKVFKLENSNNLLAPILLGVGTFILPCGFTQSMQLYSLTKGNFLEGALTMLVFAIGTLPVLALISFASVKLSKTIQSGIFFKTSGFLVLFFALFNFTSALAALGIIEPIFSI